MNAYKPIAFVAALLITAAGMFGIANYTNAAVSAQHQAIRGTTDVVHTLPTIHVYPTREQLHELRGGQAEAVRATLNMPYYSFANDTAGA